jgi:hypothetical protein
MKIYIYITLIILQSFYLCFSYWENISTWSSLSWSSLSWSNVDSIKDDTSFTWDINDNISIEDKKKLEQDLNLLLIESYKIKLDKILDKLNDNIKNEIKEKQIKILTNVFISVSNKIDIVKANQKISKNRKEILIAILSHIKNSIEQAIKIKLQESN